MEHREKGQRHQDNSATEWCEVSTYMACVEQQLHILPGGLMQNQRSKRTGDTEANVCELVYSSSTVLVQ